MCQTKPKYKQEETIAAHSLAIINQHENSNIEIRG
jgi:hypothetical protein